MTWWTTSHRSSRHSPTVPRTSLPGVLLSVSSRTLIRPRWCGSSRLRNSVRFHQPAAAAAVVSASSTCNQWPLSATSGWWSTLNFRCAITCYERCSYASMSSTTSAICPSAARFEIAEFAGLENAGLQVVKTCLRHVAYRPTKEWLQSKT